NSVALVTGSSSGIGLAIARRLHAAGWVVVLNGYGAESVGCELSSQLPGSIYIDGDVGDAVVADSLIEAAVAHGGHLDLLVNNAGVARQIPHDDLDAVSDEFWDTIMRINLKGVWNASK